MKDDNYTINSGHLDVGDGHQIYYQEWGDKTAAPILSFHGGPGSATKNKHKNIFDPKKHHVIFFDQRGCGNSKYIDPLKNNTTQHLCRDAIRLLDYLSVDKAHIYGYSWGSTLALYFATKHTSKVSSMIIGGVFLGTNEEINYLFNGGYKEFAPEAWDYYCEPVPNKERDNPLAFYATNLLDPNIDDNHKLDLAKHYSILESSMAMLDNDYYTTKINSDDVDLEDITSMTIGLHYFSNDCFIPSAYFKDNLVKLKKIQCVIVQGTMDFVCPPATAKLVADTLGESAHLHLVPTSHAREGAMRETIKAYVWSVYN